MPPYYSSEVLDAGDDMFMGSARSSEDVVPVRYYMKQYAFLSILCTPAQHDLCHC